MPAGRGRTAFVDAPDIAAVAVEVLRHPADHIGKAWTPTGSVALTYDEVATALTAELQRPVRYARPGAWRYARHARRVLGMPFGMVLVTTAIYTTARLGLADGLTDDIHSVLGREPQGIKEFAHRERAAWARSPAPATEVEPSPQDQPAGTTGSAMRVAVLGGTGRTGRLLVAALLANGHQVRLLVRNGTSPPDGVDLVVGDARDRTVLRELLDGCGMVISALGPVAKDKHLHRDVAPLLIAAMKEAGMTRFIGISGAGIDVPGDNKSRRDRIISTLIQKLGGDAAKDKTLEYEAWRDSGLAWTLVRPPRLQDGPATGSVDEHATDSPAFTTITRAGLAAFLAGLVAEPRYLRQAPLVAGKS